MAQEVIYKIGTANMGVQVILPGGQTPLEIGENGILDTSRINPMIGFCPALFIEKGARIVIAQKNVGRENGGYFRHTLAQLTKEGEDVITWVMHDPIQVLPMPNIEDGFWTVWHDAKTNRIDVWYVDKNGRLILTQIGVLFRGKNFRLLAEPRWQGYILRDTDGQMVARPENAKWGALLWNKEETRADIREHPEFKALLANAELSRWSGGQDEPYPPLMTTPEGNYARMDWWVPFAGQRGQGIAKNNEGASFWVSGESLEAPVDEDGIVRLYHGDLISYAKIQPVWGKQKKKTPKLLGVRKIQ